MNTLLQRVFDNRGYTEEFLRSMDQPECGKLTNVDAMCIRLRQIHDAGDVIVVYPDYDMDGIAAGTLGFAGLREMGFRAGLFVPNPDDGYGVSLEGVQKLLDQYPDTRVIITCDTGIAALEASLYCRDMGVTFLVTDHHEQTGAVHADVVVDPSAYGSEYEHKGVCGAFVFWQVLRRYAELYESYLIQERIDRLRVFAGIGTVSDSMPLLYENRQLVRDALSICRMVYNSDGRRSTDAIVKSIEGSQPYRLAFRGLYELLQLCAENGKISDADSITEDLFGFYLAPMFNSVKRMGGDMARTYGLFLTSSPRSHAEYLWQLNAERKAAVASEMQALRDRPQPYAPYIWYSDAREGVLGLLATRIMEETGTPVFVMNDRLVTGGRGDRFHGSGRCPEWYNAIDRLGGIPERFYVHIGGHQGAFGWGVGSEEDLKKLFEFLSRDVPAAMASITPDALKRSYDLIISTDWTHDTGIDTTLFGEFLDELEQYRPFGRGFEMPSILLRFHSKDAVEWKRMGKDPSDRSRPGPHLKIVLPNGFDVICWNQGFLKDTEEPKDGWHRVVGHLERSTFRDQVRIQFVGDLERGVEDVSN